MEDNKNVFSLTHILLIESNFKREWVINFQHPTFTNNVDISVSSSEEGENVSVTVHLKYNGGFESDQEILADIKMVGVFKIPENSDLPKDQFVNINAPAIIFPFLREHLASISIKAGVNPILLQPVNFVKRADTKQQ